MEGGRSLGLSYVQTMKDIILFFGDILLNDSMIFFALYFPNPRKSHKSHR